MIGQRVGNYVIKEKLGEGGMGEVYLAEHPQIGKRVALKVLHAELSTNREIANRFFHEAKAVNDIGHPNIVDILDFGTAQTEAGQVMYLVMELLSGTTLTKVLEGGALDPRRVVAIITQVADALAASHERGIVHRDLKPDNIMLVSRGREADFVKLLDFGIAKVADNSTTKTRTGMVMGTPIYMSPEQCEGRGAIDQRTDIYSLGIVLYEMLTGRVPFTGEGYGEILLKQMTEAPTPLSAVRPGLSPHLEQVVMKALNKRPDDRFATMRQLADALAQPERYVEQHGGLAHFAPVQTSNPHAATRIATAAPATGSPTTLSQSAGQLNSVPPITVAPVKRRSSGGLIAAGVIGVGAIAAALVLLKSRGSQPTVAADETPTPVAAATAPAQPEPAPAQPAPAQPTPAQPTPSPAQPTQPAPTPAHAEPAPPATVSISVESTPAGAGVYVGTDTTPKCTAPCSFDAPRGGSAATVTLRLAGYADAKQTVQLTGDQQVKLALEKKVAGKRKPAPTAKPVPTAKPDGTQPVGDNTLNPFK